MRIFRFNIVWLPVILIPLFLLVSNVISFADDNEKNLKDSIKKIVCVLPLTGNFGRAGHLALRGVAVANEILDKEDVHEVVVLDTGTENVKTVFEKALEEKNTSFIIGPVPYGETDNLGPLVNKINVPVVVFPLEKENFKAASNLVRFFYPLDKQAQVLVDFISANKNIFRFGILYPENRMGREFRKYYESALRRNGKLITYKGSYDPNTLDISTELQWIKSLKPDVIFIPDGASRSSTIIKKILENRSLFNTFFLGPSTWNSDAFKRDLDSKIDGVIYKTIFTDFIDTNSEEWTEFETIYKKLFNDEPGPFEYRVYKISKLLLSLEKTKKVRGTELVKKLANEDYAVEDFEINATENGIDIYPKPMVLTLENGVIRKVK